MRDLVNDARARHAALAASTHDSDEKIAILAVNCAQLIPDLTSRLVTEADRADELQRRINGAVATIRGRRPVADLGQAVAALDAVLLVLESSRDSQAVTA